MAQLVQRMRRFGPSIFTEMTMLAREHGAINLGQGAPDSDGPLVCHEAAVQAMREGHNQYSPGNGIPELREAIAAHQRRFYGIELDPATQVCVCAGATEGIAAAILALVEPGDEVITLEPYYDSYPAAVELAQGRLVPVRLEAPGFAIDADRLRAAVTPRSKVLLLNAPHNPTGHAPSREELQAVADVAIEHDLTVVTDEVYEHLVFDGREHTPIATLPGMFERTLTVSSGGKTFSTTGWKIGWFTGPAELVRAVVTVKQFLSFSNGHPFQFGIAAGLGLPDEEFAAIRDRLQSQRDLLVPALEATGMRVFDSQATYFVVADLAPLGVTDGYQWCREMPERIGVGAVPLSPFYADGVGEASLVRFGFCKQPEVIAEATQRLAALRS